MKRHILFVSAIILSLFFTSLNAQPQGQRQPRTPESTAKSQVEWMTKELSLNQATQTKVYDIFLKYEKKLAEERKKLMAADNREAMRAKRTEINNERDKELKTALGDKTFELYKTRLEARRAAMQQQRSNR
jgi:Skp family chaperone for outer membrane proteins